MTTISRVALGLALSFGAGLLMAALSQAPLADRAANDALIRLTVGGRPERIEQCRRLSDEELASVPAHMRQRVKCEGTTASYRLALQVDGLETLRDSLVGGGIRHDRPIHLFREVTVAPGAHRIELRIARVETIRPDSAREPGDSTIGAAVTPDRARREAEEQARARREALPATLELGTDLTLEAGEVALIVYDPETRRLAVMRRQPRKSRSAARSTRHRWTRPSAGANVGLTHFP